VQNLAPYGTDGQFFTMDGACQLQSHVTQKLGQISKIRHDQIYILCPSLIIGGQLPVAIVNGEKDSFRKWPDFQL